MLDWFSKWRAGRAFKSFMSYGILFFRGRQSWLGLTEYLSPPSLLSPSPRHSHIAAVFPSHCANHMATPSPSIFKIRFGDGTTHVEKHSYRWISQWANCLDYWQSKLIAANHKMSAQNKWKFHLECLSYLMWSVPLRYYYFFFLKAPTHSLRFSWEDTSSSKLFL